MFDPCHYDKIMEKLDIMATTLAQLDAALAAQGTLIQSLQAAFTQLDTDVTTALANATAGVDVTSELTTIQAQTSALNAALTAVQAEDATVNPPAA